MLNDKFIFLCFLSLGLLCSFAYIFMTFYLARSKMKEIDRLVYGYEIPNDSIFYQGFRMMDYGGAFAWRFYARRIGKEWIRQRFDKKFKRPFIANFWLIVISGFFLCVAVILNEFFLQITD